MALRINGEGFQVSDSHLQRDATGVALEVEGRASAELRLTELDQTEPAGYYRLRVNGDKLLVQRASKTTLKGATWRDWVDADTLMEISKAEVSFKVPIDLSSLGGFTGMLIDTVPLDVPSAVWLGDGHGPSEDPAGWFSMLADDGDSEPVYVPFWRNQG